MRRPVLEPVRIPFRAMAAVLVPAMSRLDPVGWERAEAVVEAALAERPEGVRRQLVLFIRMVDLAPLLWWGRSFTGLDPERGERLLRSLERSPVLALRRGVWGLRTLALMGFYGRPEAGAAIGYRAHPDGWSARRGTGDRGDGA